MKNGFVKSAPHFFRLIKRSMAGLTVTLLLYAALLPAPLQQQADPSVTPNPAKSAWFLLWVQELVSWSRFMIYPVILVACLFLALPWLPVSRRIYRASWFPCEQRAVSALTVMLAIVIVVLTVVALFFRGANWSFAR